MKAILYVLSIFLLGSCYLIRDVSKEKVSGAYVLPNHKFRSDYIGMTLFPDGRYFYVANETGLIHLDLDGTSYSSGTYKTHRNKIILNSDYQPDNNINKKEIFTILKNQKNTDDSLVIKIYNHQSKEMPGVRCRFYNSKGGYFEAITDEKGLAKMPRSTGQRLSLRYYFLYIWLDYHIELDPETGYLELMMLCKPVFYKKYVYMTNKTLIYRNKKIYDTKKKKLRCKKLNHLVLAQKDTDSLYSSN
jgi:hypothetical protein